MASIRKHAGSLLPPLLAGLCSLPVWITRYPAIIDFPLHIAKAQIARHPELFKDIYIYTWRPRPYMFFDLCTVTLGRLLPVLAAGKIMLTLYIASALATTVYILHKDNAPLLPILFWPVFSVYNWWYGVGSVNLLFGHLSGIICITWYYHHTADSLRRVLPVLTGFLALILLCHPMSFLITVSLIILTVVWRKPQTLRLRLAFLCGYSIAIAGAAAVINRIVNQPWTPGETAGQLLWLLHDYRPAVETKVFKILLAAMTLAWLTQKKELFRSFILPVFLLFITFITPTRVDMAGHNQLRIMQFFILALPFFVPSPRRPVPRATLSFILATGAGIWIFLQCQKQLHYSGCFIEAERIAALLPQRPRLTILQHFTSAPHHHAGFYCIYYRGGSITSLYETPFWGIHFADSYKESLPAGDPGDDSLRLYSHLLYFKDEVSRPQLQPSEVELAGFRRIFTGKWLDCYENTLDETALPEGNR